MSPVTPTAHNPTALAEMSQIGGGETGGLRVGPIVDTDAATASAIALLACELDMLVLADTTTATIFTPPLLAPVFTPVW